MKVFGADFSKARDPSRGIYYAQGILCAGELIIERVFYYDDRMDLLAAIYQAYQRWLVTQGYPKKTRFISLV